ncbi:MAG: N-acetylmuramoyl-L-alanine amidase [Terrimicrobiaceae bacterium]
MFTTQNHWKSWISLRLSVLAATVLLVGCAGFEGGYGPGAGHFDTVVVDAGHGAHDPGASAVSGSREKVLALDTSQRLAKILRSRGLRVIETRSSDVFISLPRRVEISNRTGNAIFVSVHYNWSRRRGANGIEIFYYNSRSRRLAANVLKETLRAYPTTNRGVKTARFHVLRNNRRPAILCELGFLSNPKDNSHVQKPSVRQRLAEKIAAGILAEKAGRSS